MKRNQSAIGLYPRVVRPTSRVCHDVCWQLAEVKRWPCSLCRYVDWLVGDPWWPALELSVVSWC